MTICRKCNEEGGDALYCNNCGARLDSDRKCPACGAALRAAANYCPACGASLEAKEAPPPEETREAHGGGYRGGDIGIFRGKIDSSSHTTSTSFGGASAGNIIIGIPPATPGGPPQAVCPVCGEYPELRASFRCLHCNRDYICLRHRDAESNWCKECAASERPRRVSEVPGTGEQGRGGAVQDQGGGVSVGVEDRRGTADPRRGGTEGTTRGAEPQDQSGEAPGERHQGIQMPPTARLIGDGVVWTNVRGTDLLPIVQEVLQSFGATDLRSDAQTQTVTGKTGLTWKSIGQIVSATIQRLPDGSSITVVSKPKPPQIYDGGRGASDARQIASMLLRRLGAGQGESGAVLP